MRTNSRETDYVYPRMIYARVCLKRGISLTQIGKRLNRNHATISSYLKKYEDYYKYNLYFKKLADDIMKKYKQKVEENDQILDLRKEIDPDVIFYDNFWTRY